MNFAWQALLQVRLGCVHEIAEVPTGPLSPNFESTLIAVWRAWHAFFRKHVRHLVLGLRRVSVACVRQAGSDRVCDRVSGFLWLTIVSLCMHIVSLELAPP